VKREEKGREEEKIWEKEKKGKKIGIFWSLKKI
jgi:hypothetical protein